MLINVDEWQKGTVVLCEAPDFFKGKKIAAVIGPCKDHDNSMECFLIDINAPIKRICVGRNPNDTLYAVLDTDT